MEYRNKKRLSIAIVFGVIAVISAITAYLIVWNNTLVFPIFIDSVNFYESPDFHQYDGTLLKVIEDNRSIQTIVHVVNQAERMPGILDVANPYYQITISYRNAREIDVLLWISKDEKTGMCMLKENTHVGYMIDEEGTQSLLRLLLGENEKM